MVQECRRIIQNIFLRGSGNAKHRPSLIQTSVLIEQNIGTFLNRSPMFLISEIVGIVIFCSTLGIVQTSMALRSLLHRLAYALA